MQNAPFLRVGQKRKIQPEPVFLFFIAVRRCPALYLLNKTKCNQKARLGFTEGGGSGAVMLSVS